MMRRDYSVRERVAAAALLVAVIAVAVGISVPAAMRQHAAAEAEIDVLGTRYREVARRQRDLAALEQLRDKLRDADRERFGILVADTSELARAEIQRMIQDAAMPSGAAVAQMRAVTSDSPSRISTAITLRIPADGLPEFLERILGAELPLFIDSIDIRSDARRRRRQRETEVPTTLSVEIVVSAFVALAEAGAQR